MSRSNNVEIKNPVKYFLSWDSDNKCFKHYVKAEKEGEKGKNETINLPFSFLVLETLHTIKGFSDSEQAGFYSNEVRNIKTDELNVKLKKGTVAKGNYEAIKTHRSCVGAKYCQSVYIAMKEDKELIIANMQLTGAALSAWIDFCGKNKIYEGAITIVDTIEGSKGKNVYNSPIFKKIPITPEQDKKAIELDKELQAYLTAYFARSTSDIQTDEKTEEPAFKANDVMMDTMGNVISRNPKMDTVLPERKKPEPIDPDEDDGLPF